MGHFSLKTEKLPNLKGSGRVTPGTGTAAVVIVCDHDPLVAQFASVKLRYAVLGVLNRRHPHDRRQVTVALQVYRYVQYLKSNCTLISKVAKAKN